MGVYVIGTDMSSPRTAVEAVFLEYATASVEGSKPVEVVDVLLRDVGVGTYHLWALVKIGRRHYGYEGRAWVGCSEPFEDVISITTTPADTFPWTVRDFKAHALERGYETLTDSLGSEYV